MRYKRRPIFASIAFACLALVTSMACAAGCLGLMPRDNAYQRYMTLQNGMSYEEVLAVLGSPGDFSRNNPVFIVTTTGHSPGQVVRQWLYDDINILLGFDLDDKLTGKECYFSPVQRHWLDVLLDQVLKR